MRVWIAAIGRLRTGPLAAVIDGYAKRSTWHLNFREVEVRRRLTGTALRAAEGDMLLAAVPNGATLVAMDEGGENLSSAAFAERLAGWRDDGAGDVAFLIGGADGLAPAVLERAALKLAFGRATWPHMMVRALLAEQIYRAQTILAGHPYHRE